MTRSVATRYSVEQRAEMVRLYRDEQLSLAEIGRRFDCDHTTVRTWVRRAGVTIRGSREHAALMVDRVVRAVDERGRVWEGS